jgi:hypothetical protein
MDNKERLTQRRAFVNSPRQNAKRTKPNNQSTTTNLQQWHGNYNTSTRSTTVHNNRNSETPPEPTNEPTTGGTVMAGAEETQQVTEYVQYRTNCNTQTHVRARTETTETMGPVCNREGSGNVSTITGNGNNGSSNGQRATAHRQ